MSLKWFALQKAVAALLTIIAIVCVNFVIFRIAPGDPIRMMFRDPRVSAEQLEAMKEKLRGSGVQIESEICWPGAADALSIYCRDPAGNSVEFATRSLWFGES